MGSYYLMFIFIMFIVMLIMIIATSESNLLQGIGILVIFLVAIGGLIFLDKCTVQEVVITPLYAGYNQGEINGSFFLGSGRVDEVDTVFYWVNDGGILTKHSVFMRDSKFIEDGKNILESTYYVCPKLGIGVDRVVPESFLFHVPQNSIVNMYQFK